MTKAKYIPRLLQQQINKYIKRPEILAILGPRRSGKTTLLSHFRNNLDSCQMVSFENQVILDLFDLEIDSFAKRYLNNSRTLIIDEFQHAKRGGKNLKYLYDSFPGKKIIVSGSSSPDLTIKALRYLTGRCLLFTLLPFSFHEFISAKPFFPTEKELMNYFAEYVTFGGYPEVVLENNSEIKKTLLQNIYSLFFTREVKDFTSLSDDYKLKKLVKALSLSSGSLIEYRQLGSLSGFDFLTLKRYLNFLEKTYIISLTPPFFTNKRTELVKNPKVYFYDLGLRNSLIDNFLPFESRTDKGFLLENFIASYFLSLGQKVKFWRTKNKAEVDFILEKEGLLYALETKAGIMKNIPLSLVSFIEKYHPKKAFIVSCFKGKRRYLNNIPLEFVPYWHPELLH